MIRVYALLFSAYYCALLPFFGVLCEVRADQGATVATVLQESTAAYHRLVDYRGTLKHRIWKKGGVYDEHEIEVTFRKPGFVRMEWRTGLYEDTTLITRPTRAFRAVFIKLGGWFDFLRVAVPTTEVSEPFSPALKDINAWLYALRALHQRPVKDRSLQLLRLQTVDPEIADGRIILTVPAFLIPFRDNTVDTYEFAIEKGTGLPLELVLRGASGEVQQRISYLNLETNIGIRQNAFLPKYGATPDTGLIRVGTEMDVRGFTQNWVRRSGEIRDYTGLWVTENRSNNKFVRRKASFKFRKPLDVYLLWGEDGGELKEALFRTGWNGGRARVRGSLLSVPVIGDVVPDGYWMRGRSHHPIDEFGFGRTVERLQSQLLQGWLRGELEVQFRGIREHDSRPCYVLEFVFPNNQWRTHPHYRLVLHWDIEYRVPVKQEAYDWGNQLETRQGFEDLRFNVSLEDSDFEPANAEYDFLFFRSVPWLDWFLTGRG